MAILRRAKRWLTYRQWWIAEVALLYGVYRAADAQHPILAVIAACGVACIEGW